MFVLQHNDGRVSYIEHKGEARFWAWMSMEMIMCNVYRKGHTQLLSPFDI